MALYRKKPVIIEAKLYDGGKITRNHITNWSGGKAYEAVTGEFVIATLEGEMRVGCGDYVIKGVAGEYYPCKPEIFNQTYELWIGE